MHASRAASIATRVSMRDVDACMQSINKLIATTSVHRGRQVDIDLIHFFISHTVMLEKLDLVIAQLRERGYVVKLNAKEQILRVIW